jgi:hypothetical protein
MVKKQQVETEVVYGEEDIVMLGNNIIGWDI